MPTLENNIAIVTGASRGLGEGIAVELAARGATVVCADLHSAEDTAAKLQSAGSPKSTSAKVDVSSAASVNELVGSTVDTHGRLDIMVNNAGIYTYGAIAEVSDEDFRRTMDVNVGGVFHGARAAARVMKQQKSGRIINTASQLGKLARPNEGVYSASKAAVILMTQALGLELAPYNITVNAVCPGCMHTEMMEASFAEIAESEGITLEQKMQNYLDASIPTGRFGTLEDMGRMVAWLASDEASFTTGSALNLTGGEQVFF
ncbi:MULTISPECIES: SDR family NAD(P)-dependent oxidoreductase [unclassified Rhodococcus (in: high G+C Gram-positive bacteria)]|uniref:SDR family NAD(P)-dependent oxidoreductase n=1 Tax=unclassified Rhodococcus (in: high G+C Gram-positive bacteria) TaxID=192944 RepID=UPI00163B4859|nr:MULTISPECIES: SDR family oxidoreductase [unclassified Rhodococcus (in: high G+C Gram-positive bacteria)]MBC2637775.1 SDR family oxidoreductase [Rhodococcus sp. 3A]MBC2897480.1 SDR family oxidoreductase [Rhodococcus sp. 4CII]